MGFPWIYREIRRLVTQKALQTRTARAIARKAGLKIRAGQLIRIANSTGIFSYVNSYANDLAYTGAHDAGLELPFPRDTPTIYPHAEDIMVRQGDYRGFGEARFIANVTAVGTGGASVFASVDDGLGVRGFLIEPPSFPLDEVGFHVSDWKPFAWDVNALGTREERIRWLIDNPGGEAGSFYVGFCQLQTR